MHRLPVVDFSEVFARAVEVEAEAEAQAEEDNSSLDEPVHDIDELRRATPTRIWHL